MTIDKPELLPGEVVADFASKMFPQEDGEPDAVILLSFGGPRGHDDVMPFLRNVTAGRGVPDDRLAVVAEHYHARGGKSPINEQNEQLRECVEAELHRRGLVVDVTLGNRNWDPYFEDVLAEVVAQGHRRITVVPTSAYPSYSGCRQYREDIARGIERLGDDAVNVRVSKVPHYWNHSQFAAVNAEAVQHAIESLDCEDAPVHVAFVTHSIPTAMAAGSGPEGDRYQETHLEVARKVMARIGRPEATWALTYCSRSGSPRTPWLEPDINDHLRTIDESHVVIAPIGFISDHMEVIHDLDTEALETAQECGLTAARAATVGVHPGFISAMADRIMDQRRQECPAFCCPNARKPETPAACQFEPDLARVELL